MAKFLQKNAEAGKVEFVLGNGKKLVCLVKEIPDEMLDQLILHGLSQKVGDAAASCAKGSEFGKALGAMSATWDNILQNKWRADGGSGSSALIEALVEQTGKTEEEVRKAVNAADEEKLKAWRGNAKVKAIMARIQAERAAAKADDAEEEEIEL